MNASLFFFCLLVKYLTPKVLRQTACTCSHKVASDNIHYVKRETVASSGVLTETAYPYR